MSELMLQGIGSSELALLLMRISVGLFFAISGYHKLFNADRHAGLVKTLNDDRIPMIGFVQWFLPLYEFIAGLWLAVGFLTVPVAIGFIVLLVVALCTDGIKQVARMRPIDFADTVDDYLYLAECVYILMLLAFVLSGPGMFSIDGVIF